MPEVIFKDVTHIDDDRFNDRIKNIDSVVLKQKNTNLNPKEITKALRKFYGQWQKNWAAGKNTRNIVMLTIENGFQIEKPPLLYSNNDNRELLVNFLNGGNHAIKTLCLNTVYYGSDKWISGIVAASLEYLELSFAKTQYPVKMQKEEFISNLEKLFEKNPNLKKIKNNFGDGSSSELLRPMVNWGNSNNNAAITTTTTTTTSSNTNNVANSNANHNSAMIATATKYAFSNANNNVNTNNAVATTTTTTTTTSASSNADYRVQGGRVFQPVILIKNGKSMLGDKRKRADDEKNYDAEKKRKLNENQNGKTYVQVKNKEVKEQATEQVVTEWLFRL